MFRYGIIPDCGWEFLKIKWTLKMVSRDEYTHALYLKSFRKRKKILRLSLPRFARKSPRPISCTGMHRNGGTKAENTWFSLTTFRTARLSPIRFSRSSHPSPTTFPLKKNLCTEFHDNRTIQSQSLRQRRTDERTRFTKAFTFFTSKTTHTQRHVRLRSVWAPKTAVSRYRGPRDKQIGTCAPTSR